MSKKLWFASVPSVIFMTTMFVSSTFAWFTDFAVNSGNRVQSGNLAVGFASSETISDGNLSGTIQDLKLNPNEVFNLGNAAQPGDYQERYLRVRNEGNIAIDYEIDFVVNVDTILAEVIDFEIQPLGGSTTTVVGTNIDQGIYISLQDNVQGTGGLLRASTETPQEYEIWRVKMIYTSRAGNTYNDENLVFEVDIRLNAWQFNYQESREDISSQSSSSSSNESSSQIEMSTASSNNNPLMQQWVGFGFQVVQTSTDVTITYSSISSSFWEQNAQLPVVGFDGTKTKIEFSFIGEANQSYLIKIEGNGVSVDLPFEATGEKQILTLSLTNLTTTQRSNLNLIAVFARTTGASGTMIIDNWTY
jgi:hypothetical protein